MKFVAVSSCPTGIAHTYMAAEALEQAARAAGHEIVVETQGSAGLNRIPPETIAAADAVIFAADVEVRERARFDGKPLVDVGVKRAISAASDVIEEAERSAVAEPATVAAVGESATAPAAAESADGSTREETATTHAAPADAPGGASPPTKVTAGAGVGTRIRQWLMTGVSYMIPFVAAGGILIALGFMIGGYEITDTELSSVVDDFDVLSSTSWAALFFHVGAASFDFLVPILAGFIAFAIADRPGLAPGIVGGALAVAVDAGFLGGIVAGFVGGFLALWISRIRVGKALRGVMPVVVIPLVATAATGLVMLVLLGGPLSAAADGLEDWLTGLTGSNRILLGALLGLMMAFDMGGPVNKVAYTFATTGLAGAATASGSTSLTIMAAVMAAGMVPPLGLALATVVRKRLFTTAERENGRAAWLLGASFITEGAIPFAAADPLRVIPSIMAGSAVTGALVMGIGNELRAPHGGIWVTGLISQPLLYLLAVAAGAVVAAGCVMALKSLRRAPAMALA
ncbi:PTS fructose transporter subunit IIC [Phytoactinopolyspora endophytica]|uniref:PTS fructose transporter subunit IIC n=1 Tax=Phytoactinopolyspora endophytica TaxID=1642495 RepID=UPI00101B93B8|nr:fructose-specific PTS transporter subunit EIIC [Phytoactinopolyspora endophytica]